MEKVIKFLKSSSCIIGGFSCFFYSVIYLVRDKENPWINLVLLACVIMYIYNNGVTKNNQISELNNKLDHYQKLKN